MSHKHAFISGVRTRASRRSPFDGGPASGDVSFFKFSVCVSLSRMGITGRVHTPISAHRLFEALKAMNKNEVQQEGHSP